MDSIRRAREENLIDLVKRGIGGDDAMLLQRISHRLHQLDITACNYGLTDIQEKRVATLEKQAETIAHKYNLSGYHQGDPRGWSLYLIRPGTGDNYDLDLAICPH